MSLENTLRTIVREELQRVFDARAEAPWQGQVKLADAAKLINVSVSTLEKWGRAGLRIHRKGRVRRVDVAELRAFMAQQEAEPHVDAKDWAQQLLSNVTPMRRAR